MGLKIKIEAKVCEDGEYEKNRMIHNPHVPLCMTHAENNHVDRGREEEDQEDKEGGNQGLLGPKYIKSMHIDI